MRYTQPQSGPVQFDKNNLTTRGIDVAFVRLDQPGLIGTAALTKAGSPTLVTTKYGQGWFLGNSGTDAFNTSNWPVLADGTEYTYLVVTQLSAIGTLDFLVNGDNAIRQFQFRIETSGAPNFIGFNTAASTFAALGTVIPIGQPQAIVARSSASEVAVFQNGLKTGSAAASGTIKGQTATDIYIGNRQGLNLHGSIGLVIRWPRALSDAEAKAVTANPWQLFRSPQRGAQAAAGGGVSSSIAWLEQNDTASISASATVSGAASWTESSDTSAITATATVSASATWSESNDAASLVATASISAAASWTEAADTASISAAAQVNCASAWTEAADTTAITATVGNAVTASAVWTEASDSAALAATIKVSGTAAWTEASDIAAITASAGNSVAGNLAWTEANDVTTITAAAQVSGNAAWVEAGDVASLSASVGTSVAGNASWVEQSDTVALLATVRVNASAGWAEQADLTGFSAQVLVSAGLAWVEASDAAAIQAPPYISPARTVTFEGAVATTIFDGFRNTVAFEGQTTLVRFQ